MSVDARFGIWRVTKFYIPLLFQAFSQSLTYPLVAGIASHGELGVNALTPFVQGMTINFMIGALGGGLVMTGLVYCKTKRGYDSFVRLNLLMAIALSLVQWVPVIDPFYRWLFEGFFALPHELAVIARKTLFYGVIMNFGFFMRNVPLVVLFDNLESGKANNATLMRIAATMAMSWMFPKIGWVGPAWGLAALTIGVYVEYFVTLAYSRKYRPRENPLNAGDVSVGAQFRFTMPLSLGGFLLMTSPLVCAAYIGRVANAADMLVLHYLLVGIMNPFGYAGMRMQAVSIEFPPESPKDHRLLWYSIISGAIIMLLPLAFATELVGGWYFMDFQNLPERLFPTMRWMIILTVTVVISLGVRGRIEGLAAIRKQPAAVMTGQIGYTVSVFLMLVVMYAYDVSGWVMSVVTIQVSPLVSIACVYAYLALKKRSPEELNVQT